MFPVVFVLLPGKSEAIYTEVLAILKAEARARKLTLCPETMMTEFETAAMNAYEFHFPCVRLVGCFFHFGQALYKRLKNDCKLGKEYLTDSDLQIWFKSVLALALVPPEQVENAYAWLLNSDVINKYEKELKSFNDYFVSNWIESPAWPIAMWNQYSNTIRTNNHVEG